MTAQGELLIGHEALRDTMKDIIVDVLGALLASCIGMFSIHRGIYWYIPALTEEKEKKDT